MQVVLVGTRKGLFLLESNEDRHEWALARPVPDRLVGVPRRGRPARRDDPCRDEQRRLRRHGAPLVGSRRVLERAEELGLPEDTGLTLEKTWHVEPGRDGEDGRLWLGAAPGALFRTDDGGETWQAVDGIVRHETRDRWHPGAGGMCCHSIALDPEEPARMYVGISAAGVFRSENGGETWTPANQGTAADFLPTRSRS